MHPEAGKAKRYGAERSNHDGGMCGIHLCAHASGNWIYLHVGRPWPNPTPLNLDPRIFSGEPYRGYKFSLSGCQDKPSGSFHLVAEPVSPTGKAKAFCTDATNNIRSSDDGLGSSCLASGKLATFRRRRGSVGSEIQFHRAIAE